MANLSGPARFAGIGLVILLAGLLLSKFDGWVSVQARSGTFVAATGTGTNAAAAAVATSGVAETPAPVETTAVAPTSADDTSEPVSGPYCALPPFDYRGFSFATSYRWPMRLRAGEIVAAYFVVADGKNVSFRIEDPSGKTIYSPGQPTSANSFQISARETGVYRLTFEKDCLFCTRAVGFNYRIF